MPLLEHIGLKPLRELTARDVRRGLEALSGKVSTRYVQMARAALARAIRYAEAHDLVGRNVATLVDNPTGQIGRPSRSFTLAQCLAAVARQLVGGQGVQGMRGCGRHVHGMGSPGCGISVDHPGRRENR